MRRRVVPSICLATLLAAGVGIQTPLGPARAFAEDRTTAPEEKGTVGDVELVTETLSAEELAERLYPDAPRDAPEVRTRGIALHPARPAPTRIGLLIRFGLDSSEIAPASYAALDQVGRMLQMDGLRDRRLSIVGHTDATGSASYNRALSLRRARAVAAYLVERHGISPDRLETDGRGEEQLLPDRPPDDPMHRRVEFAALP